MSVWRGVQCGIPCCFVLPNAISWSRAYAMFKRWITVDLSTPLRLESGLKSYGSADRCGASPPETINLPQPAAIVISCGETRINYDPPPVRLSAASRWAETL